MTHRLSKKQFTKRQKNQQETPYAQSKEEIQLDQIKVCPELFQHRRTEHPFGIVEPLTVNDIKDGLKSGRESSTLMDIWAVGTEYVLTHGHHRLAALREIHADDLTVKVECSVHRGWSQERALQKAVTQNTETHTYMSYSNKKEALWSLVAASERCRLTKAQGKRPTKDTGSQVLTGDEIAAAVGYGKTTVTDFLKKLRDDFPVDKGWTWEEVRGWTYEELQKQMGHHLGKRRTLDPEDHFLAIEEFLQSKLPGDTLTSRRILWDFVTKDWRLRGIAQMDGVTLEEMSDEEMEEALIEEYATWPNADNLSCTGAVQSI